jgi:hypothetical protein
MHKKLKMKTINHGVHGEIRSKPQNNYYSNSLIICGPPCNPDSYRDRVIPWLEK